MQINHDLLYLSEPGRAGNTDTGSNHLLPLEGKQMADPKPKRSYVPRHFTLAERLAYYSIPEPNSGCLLWIGACDSSGYGLLKWEGALHKAHRLAWEDVHGPLPPGKLACHKCDVTICINEGHLFPGTHDDNAADRNSKGRQAKGDALSFAVRNGEYHGLQGEQHHQHKLTGSAVLAIRRAVGKQADIAAEFGVSQVLVSMIKLGKIWRHL